MQGNHLEQEFCPSYGAGNAKSLSWFLRQTLGISHECGKAKALLNLNVLVRFTIDGFCMQSLKVGMPLLFLGCVLPGKYISDDEFPDN